VSRVAPVCALDEICYLGYSIGGVCTEFRGERSVSLVFSKSIPYTAREHFDDLVAQHAPVNTYTHTSQHRLLYPQPCYCMAERREADVHICSLMRSLVSLRDYYSFMCDLDPTKTIKFIGSSVLDRRVGAYCFLVPWDWFNSNLHASIC
jgi:hypothetical protein